jgi:glycosyltransferase involved in cell wall biosynthesis
MLVSVIIPTLNAGITLNELLAKLKEWDLGLKIITIDSFLKDKTTLIERKFGAKIIPILIDFFDRSRAKTFGAEESKGDILAFLTQNVIHQNNLLLKNLNLLLLLRQQ